MSAVRRCRTCGHRHERPNQPGIPTCSSHRKGTDPKAPCLAHPERGARACSKHGGATKRSKAAALRARNEEDARNAAHRHAVDRRLDPADALLEEIARTAGLVDWLRTRVEDLDPEAIITGRLSTKVTSDPDGGTTQTTTDGPGIHLWWRLYGQERDRLRAIAVDAIRAGIAERQVRLAESQGELVGRLLRQVLDDLDLTREQRSRAHETIRNGLHLIRTA